MKPFLIIKTGGTFQEAVAETGDFEDWTRRGLGLNRTQVLTVPVFKGAPLPAPETVSAAIITGSHAMVTDGDRWIEETAAWLRQATDRELPILGICFGHQLLATALGGWTDWNPRGREIGTVDIELTVAGRQDRLLGGLPEDFPAQVTHRQSAVALPPEARLLASSRLDPHQAFAAGSAWGVQFHPEFSAADTRYYIDRLQADLNQEGFDSERLEAAVKPTPVATSILRRFVTIVKEVD